MHKTRFITIGCALAILVSGACFVPPPPRHLPPPPPRHLDLRGSQSIRVVITNDSKTRNIAPEKLRVMMVSEINDQRYAGFPKARPDDMAKPHEAVLQVSITNEDASHESAVDPHAYTQWTWKILINATLTAADGSVVWSRTGVQSVSRRFLPLSHNTDAWGDSTVHDRLNYEIARLLAKQMLYGPR